MKLHICCFQYIYTGEFIVKKQHYLYHDTQNDKCLFSKSRPLLRHIRDTSIYKYNNNYSKKKQLDRRTAMPQIYK